MTVKLYVYDLETFLDCFLFVGKFDGSQTVDVFEISTRFNQREALLAHLNYLQNCGATLVGYNSLGFDYPIIHQLLMNPYTFNERTAYLKGQEIIQGQEYGQTNLRMSDRTIPQIDLAKINHFDNKNRRTSLKSLQFAMRLPSIEDLPYNPHEPLTNAQKDKLVEYCIHDVVSTEAFLSKCKHLITMRQELVDTGVLSGDVLNYSDVKIGTEYLIKKIGRPKCFISGSTPKQTPRTAVAFKDIVLPKIQFRTEDFQAVHDWFKQQMIRIGGEEKPHLEVDLAGLKFNFGLGGVHASVNNKSYKSSETHVIKDIDVSGMYVAVGIANGFAPEHLGKDFTTAYTQLQKDRAHHAKGTTMNAVLKLAGNGVYGNSNNSYSCFYDPKYTYSVTANGQLQLLQLVELLSLIPRLEIIQANTDGVTVYMPREVESLFDLWCRDWESETFLKLEEVEYKAMWLADVNNYIAIDTKGKVKRKGKYWYPVEEKDYEGVWNKDFSMMVVQKAIEPVLVNGWRPEDVVRLVSDPFDFMIRYKTTAGAKVFIGDKECSKTVRYYVSTQGEKMKKIASPKGVIGEYKRKNGLTDSTFEKILKETPKGEWNEKIHTKNKSKYASVVTSIESGRLVVECNDAKNFNWKNVDWEYYSEEIKKLIVL